MQQRETQRAEPTITTKQVTETQEVAYEIQNNDDSSLPQGQTNVTQLGQDGTKTLTYAVTYTDGVQTDRKLLSTVITTPPLVQIVAVGTYIAPLQPTCTNGTYVNSSGNAICSPEVVNSAPAGATAQCKDGTYSFSQTHSGTCSHHSGVAQWL